MKVLQITPNPHYTLTIKGVCMCVSVCHFTQVECDVHVHVHVASYAGLCFSVHARKQEGLVDLMM